MSRFGSSGELDDEASRSSSFTASPAWSEASVCLSLTNAYLPMNEKIAQMLRCVDAVAIQSSTEYTSTSRAFFRHASATFGLFVLSQPAATSCSNSPGC